VTAFVAGVFVVVRRHQRLNQLSIDDDAFFLAEVSPGDELQVIATLVRSDDYTAICAGQLLKAGAVCAFAVMEVYFVDE